MSNRGDPEQLIELLFTHRRTLAIRLKQLAAHSPAHTPPIIFHDIDTARAAIAQLKRELASLGVPVADTPGDVETPGEQIARAGDWQSQLQHAQELFARLPLDVVPAPAPLPTPHRMPLTVNPLFVGREAEFQYLARALKNGTTTVIAVTTGIGGIGKTQFAAEFVHRYGQFFAGGIFWLSFAEAGNIDAEIAACGATLGLPGYEVLDVPTQVARVRQAWEEPLPRLLVFDNCESEHLLREYVPVTGGCRVLVTSRRMEWDAAVGVIVQILDVLPRVQSIALLRTFRPDLAADDTDLDVLAEEVGDLPLALHVAGSYLKRYSQVMTPAVYAAKLRSAPLQTLAQRLTGVSPTRHERDVAHTFAVSYEQLKIDDPIDVLALAVLARAAYFAPGEPIPVYLLARTILMAGDDVGESAALDLTDALRRLSELGLLDGEADSAVRLHRLLAAFVQQTANDSDAQAKVEQVINTVAFELNQQGYTASLLALQTHLRFITDTAIRRGDEKAEVLCYNFGYHLNSIGAYTEARYYMECMLSMSEQSNGRVHPSTSMGLNMLGIILQNQGDFVGAQSYFERALAIRQKVLGPSHALTATSLNNLGGLFRSLGQYDKAKSYLEQALAIWEKELGPTHPTVAQGLNNLGGVFELQGDYAAARQYWEQALALRQNTFGSNHISTAESLHNVAIVDMYEDRLEEAALLMRQALSIRKEWLGRDHPDTLGSSRSFAMIEQKRRAIAIQKQLEPFAGYLARVEAEVANVIRDDTVASQVALADRLREIAQWAEEGESEDSAYLALAGRLRELAENVMNKSRARE